MSTDLKNSTIKLVYFNGRGVIENARILLAIADVKYEDFRYPIDFTTYARPEFDEDKKSSKFDLNMGRLPILDINGSQIAQSKPIERFIARATGLMGGNEIEAALIDMITEHVRDIKQAYNDAKAGKKGEELDAAKADFVNNPEKLSSWLHKLEKTLGGNGFAIGNSISLADVTIYSFIIEYMDDKEGTLKAASSCPKILESCEKVKVAAANWLSQECRLTPF